MSFPRIAAVELGQIKIELRLAQFAALSEQAKKLPDEPFLVVGRTQQVGDSAIRPDELIAVVAGSVGQPYAGSSKIEKILQDVEYIGFYGSQGARRGQSGAFVGGE